jgi:hypothetical protein
MHAERAATTLITATVVVRDGCNVDGVSYGRDSDGFGRCSDRCVHDAYDNSAADAMLARLLPPTATQR